MENVTSRSVDVIAIGVGSALAVSFKKCGLYGAGTIAFRMGIAEMEPVIALQDSTPKHFASTRTVPRTVRAMVLVSKGPACVQLDLMGMTAPN